MDRVHDLTYPDLAKEQNMWSVVKSAGQLNLATAPQFLDWSHVPSETLVTVTRA